MKSAMKRTETLEFYVIGNYGSVCIVLWDEWKGGERRGCTGVIGKYGEVIGGKENLGQEATDGMERLNRCYGERRKHRKGRDYGADGRVGGKGNIWKGKVEW